MVLKVQIFTPKNESCVDDIWTVHDKIGNELLLLLLSLFLLFCCGADDIPNQILKESTGSLGI